MKPKIQKEITTLFSKNKLQSPRIITEADISNLPEPVQRYLRYAKIIGKEYVHSVRMKQTGFFRTGINQKWWKMKAEQYYTVHNPGFIWLGKVFPVSFLPIIARDMLFEGKGYMLVKFLSCFTMVDAKGFEMDEGALGRFLGELMWFPTALVSPYLEWEAIDSESSRVTISYKGVSASAIILVNNEGQITKLMEERFRDAGGSFIRDKWEAIPGDYRETEVGRIPFHVDVLWKLKEGDFCYYRGDIEKIEFNQPHEYKK